MTTSRVTEVDGTSARILNAYNSSGLNTDLVLDGIMVKIKEQSKILTSAIKRSKVESLQKVKHRFRADKLRSLNYLLLSFSLDSDETVQQAAKSLLIIYSKFGLKILRDNYVEVSSEINALLDDLAAPELADAIAAVPGCAESIAQLQAAQNDFEQTRTDYEHDKGEQGTLKKASDQKQVVLTLINEHLIVILKERWLDQQDMFGEFIRTVTEIIQDNNLAVKRRQKLNKEKNTNAA